MRRSIVTVIPHELELVEEEDEDQIISEQSGQVDEPESVQPLEDVVVNASTSATSESHCVNGHEGEKKT